MKCIKLYLFYDEKSMVQKIIFSLTIILINSYFVCYFGSAAAAISTSISQQKTIAALKDTNGSLNVLLTARRPNGVNQDNIVVHIVNKLSREETIVKVPWLGQVLVKRLASDTEYEMYAESIGNYSFIFFPPVIIVQEKPAFIVIRMVN